MQPSREYQGAVTGNRRTKLYRYPWDPIQPQPANRVPFASPGAAQAQGYHLAPGSPAWRPSGDTSAPHRLGGVPGHGSYSGPVTGNPYTHRFICPGDDPSIGGPYTVHFDSVAAARRAYYFPVGPLMRTPPRAPSHF